jgi:hypothetical protein
MAAQYIMIVAHREWKLLPVDYQEARREEGAGFQYPLQGNTLSDQLPPTRPHLLKVPPPPNSTTGQEPSF